MADDITVDTLSANPVLATDEISSVHHQRVKVQHGADGAATDVSTASPLPVNAFSLLLAQGLITGYSGTEKFGHSDSVGTSWTPIDTSNTALDWPVQGQSLSVVSSDTDDDGNPDTNTGAHTVTIEGLDALGVEVSETVTLNGTNPVTTTATFKRVNRAYVLQCGTVNGTNEGDITITQATSGDTMTIIEAGSGQTEKLAYTVPKSKVAYIYNIRVEPDSTKTVDVRIRTRLNMVDSVVPMAPWRIKRRFIGLQTPYEMATRFMPIVATALTDVVIEAKVSASTADVSGSFEIVLVDT